MIFGGFWSGENLRKAIWNHASRMAHDDNFWMNLMNHNVDMWNVCFFSSGYLLSPSLHHFFVIFLRNARL